MNKGFFMGKCKGYAHSARYVVFFVLSCLLLLLTVSAAVPENRSDMLPSSGARNAAGEEHPIADAVTDAADAAGEMVSDAGEAAGDMIGDIGGAAAGLVSDAGEAVGDAANAADNAKPSDGSAVTATPFNDDAAAADIGHAGSAGTVSTQNGGGFTWILVLILAAAAAAIIFLMLMPRRSRDM